MKISMQLAVMGYAVLGAAIGVFVAPSSVDVNAHHRHVASNVDISRQACNLGRGIAITGQALITCDASGLMGTSSSKPCSIGDGLSIFGQADITCAIVPANDLAKVL
jgi:hypothetical protein